jgi:hypothetical protein
VPGEVEQRADLAHAHGLWTHGEALDHVTGADVALLEHPQIEARPPVRIHERRHARLLQPHADLEAGHPRLRDFEHRRADPIAVADADLIVGHALDGEVLAEVARRQIDAAEEPRPVLVRGPVIDVDGAMLTTVADEIGLAVAVHIEARDATPAGHGRLEDRAAHRPAAPLDVPRQTDVDGDEPHDYCVARESRRGAFTPPPAPPEPPPKLLEPAGSSGRSPA